VPKARAQRACVRAFRDRLEDPATRDALAGMGMKV